MTRTPSISNPPLPMMTPGTPFTALSYCDKLEKYLHNSSYSLVISFYWSSVLCSYQACLEICSNHFKHFLVSRHQRFHYLIVKFHLYVRLPVYLQSYLTSNKDIWWWYRYIYFYLIRVLSKCPAIMCMYHIIF